MDADALNSSGSSLSVALMMGHGIDTKSKVDKAIEE
jgi:hypothetical protein